ncbi:DiNV CH01M ORF33-like protein [Mauternbach virus]|uniref:DiNV CH01M ORF33-like protein n=1 Tax=Mauternbach virus TaxID=2486603 RepID=A0A3G3E7P4_9VIRU|nr:DiNV CH01M ORF33-like protein [Mauternbach virus]AYP97965.1 DiNV CH01M ORF33-like protein [Mauternbach virus]
MFSQTWTVYMCTFLLIMTFQFENTFSLIDRKFNNTSHASMYNKQQQQKQVNEYINDSENADRKLNILNQHNRSHQYRHKNKDRTKKSQSHDRCICGRNNDKNINRHHNRKMLKNILENFNIFEPIINKYTRCPYIIAKHLCFNKGKCFKLFFNDRTTYACRCINQTFGDRCEYKNYFLKNQNNTNPNIVY